MAKKRRYWVLADTHFGHESIVEWAARPKGYEEKILSHLNHNVWECDVVVFLGDFCWGNNAYWHEQFKLATFGANRWFVRGNHDKKSTGWLLDHGWDSVCDSMILDMSGYKVLFSHEPLALTGQADINIHGHFHNTDHRSKEPQYNNILTDRHILVKMEHEYRAFNLHTLIQKWEKGYGD